MRTDVNKAEESGSIARLESCETCGSEKKLVRHHRDYNKPLDITWLCYSCHMKEHAVVRDKDRELSRAAVSLEGVTNIESAALHNQARELNTNLTQYVLVQLGIRAK